MSNVETMTSAVVLSVLLMGCSTSKRPEAPPVTQIGNWSGPDVVLMVKHWDRQCAELGVDGPTMRELVTMTQSYSPADPNAGSRQWGPASCDENGCWHGIAKWRQVGTYHLQWPRGRHEGVIAHEVMHPLQNMLIALGDMPASEMDLADPPGHPKYMTVNGRRFKTRNVVDWRWPSVVQPMMFAAKNVWDVLCGANDYEVFEKGGGI